MIKKSIHVWALLAALVFGLALTGCGDGADSGGVSFVAKTNNATANDEATLGIVGATSVSSDAAVATVAISDGKIAITSVKAGTAVITVSVPIAATTDSLGNAISAIPAATIPVTVDENGDITIVTIVKAPGVTGVKANHAVDPAETTLGLEIASAYSVGITTYFKITGTVDMSESGGCVGTSNGDDIHDWYSGASSGGYLASPTHYGAISIDGLTIYNTAYIRISYSEAIEEYYGWAPVADSKSQGAWAGTGLLILVSKDTTVKVSKTTISYDGGVTIAATYYFDYSAVQWVD
jgi:hypothetical protein